MERNMKYFIYCPYIISSSSKSMHHLCSSLNRCGHDAIMVYEGINFDVEILYSDSFNFLKSSSQVDDSYENVIIFPSLYTREYMIKRLGLKRIRMAIWWLSKENEEKSGSKYSSRLDRSLINLCCSEDLLKDFDFGKFLLDEGKIDSCIADANNFFRISCDFNDLGRNIIEFENIVSCFSNSIFVDLGVRTGVSSMMMLNYAKERNNEVYGVDVDFSVTDNFVLANTSHKRIFGDSSSIGKIWNKGDVSVLFVDTIHAYEQVMCELYYWYQHVRDGGWIVFHDTDWPDGKHEFIGGRNWERADKGLKNFFGIESLNYEDDYILVKHCPSSWGMTFVNVKKKKDYVSLFKDWDNVFAERNYLTSIFWNEGNLGGRKIDLVLP